MWTRREKYGAQGGRHTNQRIRQLRMLGEELCRQLIDLIDQGLMRFARGRLAIDTSVTLEKIVAPIERAVDSICRLL